MNLKHQMGLPMSRWIALTFLIFFALPSWAQWTITGPLRVSPGQSFEIKVSDHEFQWWRREVGITPRFPEGEFRIRVHKERQPYENSLTSAFFRFRMEWEYGYWYGSENWWSPVGEGIRVPPHFGQLTQGSYPNLIFPGQIGSPASSLSKILTWEEKNATREERLDRNHVKVTTDQIRSLRPNEYFQLQWEGSQAARRPKAEATDRQEVGWLTLNGLEPGFYIVEVEKDGKRGFLPCLVSDLLFRIERAGDRMNIQVLNSRNGSPVQGARVWMAEGDSGTPVELVVDAQGVFTAVTKPGGKPVRFWGIRGQEAVFAERQNLDWAEREQPGMDLTIYAYSDRPIYRPGQEVHFKAIVRDHGKKGFDWRSFTFSKASDAMGKHSKEDESAPFEPGRRGLEYTVYGPQWESSSSAPKGIAMLLDKETLSFEGTFKVPLTTKPGSYSINLGGEFFNQSIPFEVLQYEKPRFKVGFQGPPPGEGDSKSERFLVKAENLHGGPVPEGRLAWDLFRLGAYRYQYWGNGPERDIEVVQSGEGTTDRQGNYLLEISNEWIDPSRSYRLLVKVTDAGGQRQMASRTIGKDSTSNSLLKLTLSRNILRPQEKLTVGAEVLDLEGETTNIPVQVRIANAKAKDDELWNQIETWEASGTVQEAKGPSANFRIPKGTYLVIAKAVLPNGESIEITEPLIVAEDGDTLPSAGRGQMRAALDRAKYAPGETARAIVLMPGSGMPLYWGLWGKDTRSSGFKTVAGTVALLEFKVPESFSPNGWLVLESVCEAGHLKHKLPIETGVERQRLKFSIYFNRESLEPQQSVRLSLQAKDTEGVKPRVNASVAVVDEAIYALAPEALPDPVAALNPSHPERGVRVLVGEGQSKDILQSPQTNNVWRIERKPLAPGESFTDPQPEDVRKAIAKEIATKPGAGATVEVVASSSGTDKTDTKTSSSISLDKMSSIPQGNPLKDLREHFLDTALWAPNVEVTGKAVLDLKMPDDLTRWRATAVGVTSDGKAGVARTWVNVSKPLQVNLVVPSNLTEGEESRAVVIIQNRTRKAMNGDLQIEAEGGQLLDAASTRFSLKAGEEQRLTWRLCPLKDHAQITVRVGATSGDRKDGEVRIVAVQKPGIEHRLQDHVVLAGSETRRTITVPSWGEESAALHFYGLSRGLEQLTAPGLHYLVKYPYGCVEQTLSSFVPNILVAELVKKGLMPPLQGKEFEGLDNNIQKGVERVYGYQMENGGWGWYGPKDFGASANPHTTGYAVMALSAMKRMGYEVDAERLTRGVAAAKVVLDERLRIAKGLGTKGGSEGVNDAIKARGDAGFLLVCLAQAGEASPRELSEAAELVLAGAWPGNTVLAQVCLAAVLQKHPLASRLLDALEASVKKDRELAYWDASEVYRYSYLSGDVYTTVLALRALSCGRPESLLILGGEAFLVTRFNGNGWDSTWVTSQVVSLLPDLAKVRKMKWQGAPIVVRVEGGPTYNLDDSKPASLPVKAGQSISFRSEGRGVVVYILTAGSQRPMVSPTSGPLLLRARRNIWKLEKPTQNIAQGWVRTPFDSSMALHEEAYMEVEVTSNKYVQYGLIEIPVPAGFEAITDMSDFVLEGKDQGRDDFYYIPEKHPDRVGFLVYWMDSERPIKVRVRLRAKLEGRYVLRPVKFSLMSDESQWCTTEGKVIQIQPPVINKIHSQNSNISTDGGL